MEAARWFKKAADQGDAKSQTTLGLMYEGGIGVPQSDTEAALYVVKAAEQRESDAQLSTGAFYSEGRGLKKSTKRQRGGSKRLPNRGTLKRSAPWVSISRAAAAWPRI